MGNVFRFCVGIFALCFLLITTVHAEGTNGYGNDLIPGPQQMQHPQAWCETHWLQSVTHFFHEYQASIQETVYASGSSVTVISPISKDLTYVEIKLKELASFTNNGRSQNQEPWSRGIVRFYLKKASSSVLHFLGFFPIATQVSLTESCFKMVQDIRTNATAHVQICQKSWEVPGDEDHFQTYDVCLGVSNHPSSSGLVSAIKSRASSSLFSSVNCQNTWAPLSKFRKATIATVIKLFQVHPDKAIRSDLVDKLEGIFKDHDKFLADLNTGKFQSVKDGMSLVDWVSWIKAEFTKLASRSGVEVAKIFGMLGPDVQKTIEDQCSLYMKLLRKTSATQLKCSGINDPSLKPAGTNMVCFLSNQIPEE